MKEEVDSGNEEVVGGGGGGLKEGYLGKGLNGGGGVVVEAWFELRGFRSNCGKSMRFWVERVCG